MLNRLRSIVNAIVHRARFEDGMTDEMRFHLDAYADDLVATGVPRAEAKRRARLEFGGVERVKEECRRARGLRVFDELRQDLHYATRLMARSPGFTAAAVMSLALGIGANTGIFSLVEALLLRQLPVPHPDELIVLSRIQGGQSSESFNYPQVRHLAEQKEIFRSLAGFTSDTFNVGPTDAPTPAGGSWVSGGYYEVLGLMPAAGRLLAPADDLAGAPAAAVISDSFWSRRFGREDSAVGQTLLIEGVPVPIVGVSAPGFAGAIVGEAADITLALSALPQLQPERAFMLGPGGRWLKIMARPREGLTREQLRARLALVWTQFLNATMSPNLSPDGRSRLLSSTLDVRAGATGSSSLRSQFRRPLLVLMGVVGLVLVIVCVNVANLMLARATTRQREVAVRMAIGASRGRVVRQLLTESALLAVAGAALGLVFASWGSQVLVGLISSSQTGPDAAKAIALDLGANWLVLVFTSLVTVSTTMFSGLMPAFQSTRMALATAMNASSIRLTGSRGRTAGVLVTAQLSVSLLLLIGAGLFLQTLRNLRTLDRGFRHEGVLLVDVDAQRAGLKGPALRAFNQEVLAIAERLPGVKIASMSSVTPLLGGGISQTVAVNGQSIGPAEVHFNSVAPRYFDTMQTPIVLGRDFTLRDDATAPRVAIVNEAFVREYMVTGHPLEQRVSIGGHPGDLQVVGVVKDAVYETLRQTPPPTVYSAYGQDGGTVTLEIYAPGSLEHVASAIRARVQPKLAGKPVRIRSFTTQLESSLVRERLVATLAGVFSALAMVLTAVGLYGLLAYTVVRRTNEIGIRLALGAQPSQVLRLVMTDAARMIAVGIALGLPAALATSRLISSMLFGLSSNDPTTIMAAVIVMSVTGLLAGFLPARRATMVDPLTALRCE
jgi:predicted permease